ncbi:MAG: DUF2911 domain-containing protein [Candidatus Kapabacteria bacterium]|jgi:hypothetical protein|nr:DUF2911 domain-containing protein [Candidatus Kapabacteria bacterium]
MLKTLIFLVLAALPLTAQTQQTGSTAANVACPLPDSAQFTKAAKSPRMTAQTTIGKTAITIDYGSPRVRGRMIWGGLIAFGTVWATGAHHATSITLSRDAVIGGKIVKAGKYGLFTIPNNNEWTVIINKNHDQHLADDYDEKLDVVRIKVTPTPLEKVQEELKFSVAASGINAGNISFAWDKLTWSFPLKTL